MYLVVPARSRFAYRQLLEEEEILVVVVDLAGTLGEHLFDHEIAMVSMTAVASVVMEVELTRRKVAHMKYGSHTHPLQRCKTG